MSGRELDTSVQRKGADCVGIDLDSNFPVEFSKGDGRCFVNNTDNAHYKGPEELYAREATLLLSYPY